MALNNIISPRQTVLNSRGEPVAGGFVFLYEPGTTTFITSYFGADLVTPHMNPVRLSGSGRADIWITLDADMVITDRNGNTVLTQDNVNPDQLGGETQSLVPNGSFEVVTAPPVPDGWVASNEAGSSNAVDSAFSTDGGNSYRFTSSGAGGGSLTTTDFFPVNDVDQLRVNFDMFSTLATVLNIVRIQWFDVSFVSISDSDVYSSTANPLAWTEFQEVGTPPANARFAKLELIGIDPSVLLAGSTYFDRVSVFYPTVVSGIFDNITIQNNEIISTNLNGEINLLPNGLGPVNMASSGLVTLADIQNSLNIGNIANPALNPHIAFDANTIQAKADATTAALLSIGRLGGGMALGPFGQVTIPAGAYDGVFIQGELNNDPDAGLDQDAAIGFYNAGGAWVARLGFDTGGDTELDFSNFVVGGTLRFGVSTAPGTFRNGIIIDPTGTTAIYHSITNNEVARSTPPTAGGWLVNNTLTGAGFERVLTTPGDAGTLLPAGTVDSATLRFDTGSGLWEEVTSGHLVDAAGQLFITDVRDLGTGIIDFNGMDENDVGLRFNDGMKVTWTDLAFANPIEMGNLGIGGGSGQLSVSAAGSFSFALLGGSFQLRTAADGVGATFTFATTVLTIAGGDTCKILPSLMLSQANSPPTGQAANVVLYQKNTQNDSDLQPHFVPGVGGIEHAAAYLNTKRIANSDVNMNTAANGELAVNGTFFYDDNAAHTITLQPSAQSTFPLQGTFTVLNAGTGTITINEGTGDTLYIITPGTGRVDTTGGLTMGAGGFCTVYRDSAGDWYAMGSELAP